MAKKNNEFIDSQVNINYGWRTSPHLWNKIKPLARQMRKEATSAEKKLWQELRNYKLEE